MPFIKRLAAAARRFVTNTRGTTAIVTAVSGAVFIGFTALAVDVGFVEVQRQSLQRALDSAALTAVSTSGFNPNNLTPVRTAIEGHLGKSLSSSFMSDVSLTVTTRMVGQERALDVRASKPVSWVSAGLLGGTGNSSLEVSTLAFPPQPVELALVLDNSGSMAFGTRMTDLRQAANSLVDAIMVDGEAVPSRVSVVPYSDHVNVGMSNRTASWMSVPADRTLNYQYCATTWWKINCRPNPQAGQPTGWSMGRSVDGVTVQSSITHPAETCDFELANRCMASDIRSVWNGCVGSRNAPLNVTDATPSTAYPGIPDRTQNSYTTTCHPQESSCNNRTVHCPRQAITPLTSDKPTVTAAINAMTPQTGPIPQGWFAIEGPVGGTYLPAGLIWGLNVLSPDVPYTEAVAYSRTDIRKVMVLMTDGVNAQVSGNWFGTPEPNWGGGVFGTQAQANTTTATLCTNIKNRGIQIYTVAYEVTDAATLTLLRNCASGPDFAFDARSATALADSFRQIGLSLRKKVSLGM